MSFLIRKTYSALPVPARRLVKALVRRNEESTGRMSMEDVGLYANVIFYSRPR